MGDETVYPEIVAAGAIRGAAAIGRCVGGVGGATGSWKSNDGT